MAVKMCVAPGCPNPLTGQQRKYCGATCRNRVMHRNWRERQGSDVSVPAEKITADKRFREARENATGTATQRRGKLYREFSQTPYPKLIAGGEMTQAQAAHILDEPKANISRWMDAWYEDERKRRTAKTHKVDLAEDMGEFTKRYFPRLLVPDFHLEWEADIDGTVGTGQRLLLLAPQRFGKSEMLIRYCMKRIGEDPNISIGWVSKTAGLAERMVGYVRQNLEHNERFISDILGEGMSFVPPNRSGLSWTNSTFTVASRSEIRKSPTMEAIGVGGTIVGRDFDLIILDDPQDRSRCMSASQRDKDAEWMFTDFLSRKEEHTGVAFIMSRQHVDDLPGRIMKDHINDWTVKIYQAHEPDCVIPERKFAEHTDCVLWPEKRSWKWLYQQKQANEAHFQRNYMNDPKTDATTYITVDEIDAIKDRTRGPGTIPSNCRLIAGIDPGEAKPVAAVLWGYDGSHRHVIDAVESDASVMGMRKILKEWPAKYGVRQFAFEKNMGTSWLQDETVKRLVNEQRLHIIQFYTSGINKNSNAIGPVAMFQRMRGELPTITIPGARVDGIERIDRLVRSWLSFDPETVSAKHVDDDLTMASWFPQITIDGWERPTAKEIITDYQAFSDPMRGF